MIAQIEEIGEVTLEDEAAIAAAEAAYANLTQDQKNLVTNYATLTAARVTYTELKAAADKLAEDKAAAKVVEDQIAAIGTVTYSKAAAIATVRNAYTALTDDQKALVANEATLTAAEAAIQELKAAIDAVEAKITAIGEVTLSKAEAIAQAKADFEALAADQQDAVENAAALTAAQAALKALQDDVADVIAMIDAIGTVTYSKAADIAAVRDAYDALNDEQKALVTNEATLTAAEAAIQELQAAIDAVEAKIDAIGEVTLSKAEAIAQAKADFEALAADQQDAVENAAALTAAQAALKALQDAVADVIAKIDAIGTVALNSKAAIETAEAAYAELNAEQQNLVTNYTTLTDARATYEELKEAADQAAIDQAAADGVKDLIDAIGTVDLDSEAAIKTAEEAYATLTPAQQDLVTNYGVLTAARTTYEELKAAAEQAAADKAAADAVIAQIGAIGTVTLDSEAAIESVEAAYEALTPAQKALVTNYNTLTTARTTYNELKAAAEQAAADKAAADEVIEKIEDIGTVSLDSIAAIEAAEAAYTALTPAQKALVTNYDDLTDARAEYDELKAAADQAAIDQAAANGMMELINNIGTVTLDSKTAIESAEAAYATLTDTQKALVTNYNILTAARAAYDQLKAAADQAAADAVIGKITAIGTVTLDSKEAIEAAEAAYASLTDAQKALVTNYATLTAARTAYDQLVAEKEAAEKEAADKAAADAAIAKINAIGTVTLESKLSIEAARVAYNALTEDQKALVSAEILLKLTNAETALKALETPDEPPKTGDTQMFVPAMLLLSLSVVGLAVVLTTKKKFF